nr:InlB B-repeat-containing protein [Anaerolineaceae bacterium]
TTPSGTFYFSNKYTGFTVYQYSADNGAWQSASPGGSASYNNKLEVRHKRNSYTLAFFNYNTTSRTETLPFEKSLAEFADYEPPKPAGLPDVYTFQGWFKDKAYSVPFDFASETMPSNDLMVYAKWAPPTFIGQVYLNVEGQGTPITLPLAYGQPIDPMTMPTVRDHEGNVIQQGDDNLPFVTVPENHKWLGWATKEGDTYINFNFNTVIYHNITLYPYYVNNAPFTVSYDANGGGGTAPIDAKNYAFGSYADLLPPTALTPPEGKVFLGWECDGVFYQPGDKIRITGNMTLTAQWGDVKDKTKVTYKPGVGGTGEDVVVENLIINGTITLIENPFTPKTGYTFVGWKNMTDGFIYQPDDVLQVDANAEDTNNILIAQWNKSYVADKIWDGGPKPTIWFQLLQNGSPYLTPVQLDGTADGPCSPEPCGYEDQSWKAKWNGLPAQDPSNNPYVYTFVEGYYDGGTWIPGPPPNYTEVYHASNDKVTNTYVPPTDDVTATKVWEDGP